MLLALALSLCPQDIPTLSVEGTRDRTGDGVAFLEFVPERETVFVGEPFEIRVRLGVSQEFLDDGIIQLFRRDLDLPVQLQAPFLDALEDAVGAVDGSGTLETGRVSFALNGRITRAGPLVTEVRAGQSYAVLELARRVLPNTAEAYSIPGGFLRFAYATEYREDFVNGRVPVDRVDGYVTSESVSVQVTELPLEGQPADFRGAMGSFEVRASATPSELSVGERLEFLLTIEAQGVTNLAQLEAPPLSLRDFHVLGTVSDLDANQLRVTYDLEPRGTRVREVPAQPFSFFDLTERGYRTVSTEPIPLVVTRPAGTEDTATEGVSLAQEDGSSPPWLLPAGALAGALLGILAVGSLLRARRRAVQGTEGTEGADRAGSLRARAAAETYHAGSEEADPADPYTEFLATVLGCPAAGVESHDLGQRLEAVGIPVNQAKRAAALLDALHAPRYGGPLPPDASQAARAMVDELGSGGD